MQFTMHVVGVCAMLYLVDIINGQTNCNIGSACDTCAADEYKTLKVGVWDIKVCCSDCSSRYLDAGYRKSDNAPYCTCLHQLIQGDCWKGEQCDQCNSSSVGSINTVPVCCANCEASGLALSPGSCNCLHNGP